VQKRVVAIIQARMGSTRLPGKVLATILGEPMLALLIRRLQPSHFVHRFVVATTLRPEDAQIERLAGDLGIERFRGSEVDCLDRYYQAASVFNAAVVVRLTADNPLVDAAFVDWVLEEFSPARPQYDYVDSGHSRTFPLGLAVEAFTFEALATAWQGDCSPQWREHVTPFIYRHPERFRIKHLASPDYYSHLRWTVDTPEDLAFMRRIY